jgi:hypothetical protein
MYPQKDLALPHSQISIKYFLNWIIKFWWSTSTRCSHSAVSMREQYISRRNYEIKYSNLMEGDLYFQHRTTKMVPWICYFLFYKIYLGFGTEVWLIPLLGSCYPNLIQSDEYSGCTVYSQNIYSFKKTLNLEESYLFSIWIFILTGHKFTVRIT